MQLIIIVAAGLITFMLLLSGEDGQRRLFYLGFASIVVGDRNIHIGNATGLVPMEVIVLLLFGFTILTATQTQKDADIEIPTLLIFVAVWSAIRGYVSWVGGSNWDDILAWTLPLVMGVPTFWVVRRLIVKEAQISVTIKILLLVSVLMSLFALIEYWYPGISDRIPGFFTGQYILTQTGFVRASFSFWGYPAGAIIVTWGMFIAYHEILDPIDEYPRWICVGVLLLGGLAVYVSGQRSSWIGLAIGVLLLSFWGKFKGWLGIVILFITAGLLPSVFWQRFNTVTDYVAYGIVTDTSMESRLARWSWGWQSMIQNPVGGVGYGHWLTHNIFLEIGSTVGVLPAILFLGFIVQLLVRVAKLALQAKNPVAKHFAWLFLALAVTWVIQLNVETIFQTPALAVAFWPYMALGWYLPNIFNETLEVDSKQMVRRLSNDHRIHSHLQL
jgi:O-antigen ligase